ncbi:MAG: VapC toxin family PIN domain ribonuclease [Gammaproteobacteria bacterium]|nr:VapC toxin family PIN domain ribonuclease [Gammaproteobacteria bacterium]
MTPDVNVLLAANRVDHPHHRPALAWLRQALDEAGRGRPLTLQPMVIASFLRLATHPKVFVEPTPIDDAVDFIDVLLASPGVVQPALGDEWTHLRQLCTEKQLQGNDLPDAWLAAAVMQQAEHLVSFDGAFYRLLPRGRFTRLTSRSGT